jgi:hypothetical protein
MARDLVSLVTTALQRCGQQQDNTGLYDQIIAEVPNVQVSLEDVADPPRPWFLKTLALADDTLIGTAGTNYLTLPAGFLAEVDDASLFVLSTDPSTGAVTKTEVEKLPYDVIQERRAILGPDDESSVTTTGVPTAYCLDKTQLLFDITLTDDTQFEWSFYSRDAELSITNKTNMWTSYGYNYLLAKTCELIAWAYLQDDNMTKRHKLWADREFALFRGANVERDLAGTDLHMGENK